MSKRHTTTQMDSTAGTARPNDVMPLKTVAGPLLGFNFHASQPDGNSPREKATRHTITLGATVGGKSVSKLVRGMYESQRAHDDNENRETR